MKNLLTKKCRQKGKNAPAWKEKVGYSAIHHWLKYNYGKANNCENRENQIFDFECSNFSKNFHWAKKYEKSYDRNVNNFMMLCDSCHKKYDIEKDWLKISKEKIISTKSKVQEWIEDNGFGIKNNLINI